MSLLSQSRLQRKGFKPTTGKLSIFTKEKKGPLSLNLIDQKTKVLRWAPSSKRLLILLQAQKNGWAKWESPTAFCEMTQHLSERLREEKLISMSLRKKSQQISTKNSVGGCLMFQKRVFLTYLSSIALQEGTHWPMRGWDKGSRIHCA